VKTNAATAALLQQQRKHWIENSLERADEDLSGNFNWNIVKKFGPYLANYKGWAITSIILMLVYTALNLANPFLIGLAIDQFISHNDLRGLAIIGIILIVVNIAMWQAQYWQVWTMSWAGQQMLFQISTDMFTHLQRLSLSFYDRTQVGRVMSRLQSDIDVLEAMLSSGLLSMLGSLHWWESLELCWP
jgi:ATP-binding cassette subfamily B protein